MSEQLTPFGSALAGALGGVFSNAIVYPLDTVKTRIQAAQEDESTASSISSRPKGTQARMLNLLLRIIKQEGILGLFKGFAANMINTFSMQFAYFFFHTLIRTAALKRATKRNTTLSTASELSVGALAGGLAQIFTIPVAVIATRQQLHAGSSSLLATGREIVHEGGVSALWTGLKPGLVLTVNPAITYGVFERVRSWAVGGGEGKLSPGKAFVVGVASKTLATVVTYPYIFAKVRLQAQPSAKAAAAALVPKAEDAPSYAETASHSAHAQAGEEALKHRDDGAIALLLRVFKSHGFKGWYRGMSAQIVKAVLSQGILFVFKDQFEAYALMLMLAFARVKTRAKVVA